MRINEVKETREVVVRTEYVAEDEEVFSTKEECEKYEESAIFVVSKKLKRLHKKNVMHSDILKNVHATVMLKFSTQKRKLMLIISEDMQD